MINSIDNIFKVKENDKDLFAEFEIKNELTHKKRMCAEYKEYVENLANEEFIKHNRKCSWEALPFDLK